MASEESFGNQALGCLIMIVGLALCITIGDWIGPICLVGGGLLLIILFIISLFKK